LKLAALSATTMQQRGARNARLCSSSVLLRFGRNSRRWCRWQQVSRPVEAAMTQPGADEPWQAGVAKHLIDCLLVLWRRGAGKRKRNRPKIEVEQAIACTGLVVVIALGLSISDDLDLPCI